MKHIFTISLCFLALSLSAQENITYPYNPDGDADGLVAVPDIQDLLAVYGSPFSPAEIMVGDTALSEWIQILYQALQDQQAVIEAMQGAGRCDFSFPEGIHGEPVIYDMSTGDYTVPDDKSLYIINLYTNNCALSVEDIIIHNAQSNTSYPNTKSFSLNQPIIVGSGEVVSANDQPGFINGLLIDKQVNPITHQLFNDETFEVPLGKTLYITHLFSGGQPNLLNFLIDNNIIFSNDANHSIGESIQRPIIINSGRVLSLQTDNSGIGYAFNGYLVDEDYFADCGGGGSSDGGSVSSLDSLTIASMINNAILQQIGHGDNYQGGIVAYIFQPGDAAYVAGEVHGYLAYYDGTTIGWGCEGVTTAIGVNNTSVGQGPVNTQQLVNTCNESDFAAKWCNDLVIGGNSDWFLPNVSELMLFQPAALYTICGGCSITAWTSQEAVVGLYGCTGNSNSCCYPVDFANTFFVTGSGNETGSHNRKMPGGINACGGWGGSHVIAYRQF